MNFEFATASRILFGRDKVRELPSLVRSLGGSALVVTGRHPERYAPMLAALESSGVIVAVHRVVREPTVNDVVEGGEAARESGAEVIVGVGGGSVLDAAKGIAAFARNPDDPFQYLEVIGRGQPLKVDPLPVIAVPTTAGTGSEVTRNAVLGSPEHQVKVSLRHARLLPRLALIDPVLALEVPREVTLFTGLDALTQLVEPWLSIRANPMTDAFCRAGLERVVRSLETVVRNGSDLEARENMAFGSLMGGLALANAGLGVVHGLAGPMGGMFGAAHGALCAALLVPGLRANLRAIRARSNDARKEQRFTELARLLTGHSTATAEQGIEWIQALIRELGVHGIRTLGVAESQFEAIASKGLQASSMKANPITLEAQELVELLRDASTI